MPKTTDASDGWRCINRHNPPDHRPRSPLMFDDERGIIGADIGHFYHRRQLEQASPL